MSRNEPRVEVGEMANYLFEYRHGGRKWGLTISAESEEDAKARIYSIQHATFLGTEVMRIRATLKIWPRLMCWIHNRGIL